MSLPTYQKNKLPVTVLIATKNEEGNLPACLDSVTWAAQVLVIDSGSDDQTEQIARECEAEFHEFHYDGKWPKKRNWALKSGLVNQPWVLILDADERVSSILRDSIQKAITQNTHDGFYLRWKFVFLGKWMKHAWNHGWMLRLFRHGKGIYENLKMTHEGGWDTEVHENVIVQGSCDKLSPVLDHESSHDLHRWILKQNEFSTWNAQRRLKQSKNSQLSFDHLFSSDPGRRRKAMKGIFLKLPAKPFLLFVWLYFFKRGFLDGRAGLYFCCLRASHELNICAKIFEAKRHPENHPHENS
ncbi:glycosyltransferase family 2 protein [Verrucomicrobia bacterium]|nr:glycosyltransferase family 2 protein [Verrucomicrobiota bacterium]MDB4664816.1 glycosyltransferase family 2 protein [Verrucomicrobiota bacterium]MDC0268171.1 glycosyltransferase family 2 protein [bacterium]MDG1889907.1 glycosyltransferase family 2 protein [Verrucomicrobiota bacterium]